jgi:hypothetical protein
MPYFDVDDFRLFQDQVLDFAVQNGLMDQITEKYTTAEFMLELAMLGFLQDMDIINPQETLDDFEDTHLNWLLFEKVWKRKKTIAEFYVENSISVETYGQENISTLAVRVRELREPVHGYFEVQKKLIGDVYSVTDMETGIEYLIKDRTTRKRLRVGQGFIAKLHRFGKFCFISTKVILIPPKIHKEARVLAPFINTLELEYEDFVKSKGLFNKRDLNLYDYVAIWLFKFVFAHQIKNHEMLGNVRIPDIIAWIEEEGPTLLDKKHRKALERILEHMKNNEGRK